jgi:hypothetical protein
LSWRPTTLVAPNVEKSGALTYPDPLGPLVACCGSTFTFIGQHNPLQTYIQFYLQNFIYVDTEILYLI